MLGACYTPQHTPPRITPAVLSDALEIDVPKKRPKGRATPPRDRLIAGEMPRSVHLTPEQQRRSIEYLAWLEKQAQDGYQAHGRGFLVISRFEGDDEPHVAYAYPGNEWYEGFVNEDDLMEAVGNYDPAMQFVVFEALANMQTDMYTDINISVWGYRFIPPLTLSA